MYYVRKRFTDLNNEVTATEDLTAAIVCCDKNDNTKVYNENGDIIHISEFGIIDGDIKNNTYALAIITSPTGTYLRATADYNGVKILSSPVKNSNVYILNKNIVNGFYKVEIIKKGIHYIGYMIEENLKVLSYK